VSSQVQLTRGLTAIVDDADAAWAAQWKWKAMRTREGNEYAARIDRGGCTVFMHRELLGLMPGHTPEVDHRNHDTLDNRRDNLRQATAGQNHANAPMKGNRLGFKGVMYDKKKNRYRAEVGLHGERRRSRWLRTVEEAAHAYDVLAVELHGEFAMLNFNPDGSPGPAVTKGEGYPNSLQASGRRPGTSQILSTPKLKGKTPGRQP